MGETVQEFINQLSTGKLPDIEVLDPAELIQLGERCKVQDPFNRNPGMLVRAINAANQQAEAAAEIGRASEVGEWRMAADALALHLQTPDGSDALVRSMLGH